MENDTLTIKRIVPTKKDLLPHQYCESLNLTYANNTSDEEKKKKGQFFTPIEISNYMASMATCNQNEVSILDPGCGCGVLSISLIEHIIMSNDCIQSINLVTYENDKSIIPYLKQSLEYTKEWLRDHDTELFYTINEDDFILSNKETLKHNTELFINPSNTFDVVISNPPYFKIGSKDPRTVAGSEVVNGHANIYSLFMATSAKLLKPNGELIVITPRSFTSGQYFQQFRNFLFEIVELETVHLFDSRKDTFAKDKVLQETVITKYRRTENKYLKKIQIRSSNGITDLKSYSKINPPISAVVNYNSVEKILSFPINRYEQKIVELFNSWSGTLNKYNIQISTGKVVAFRAKEFIKEKGNLANQEIAPLYWLHNVSKMNIAYPISKEGKGQYLAVNQQSNSILIDNSNYIFLRRFSSKDDKSRLIAAPYLSNSIHSIKIGVENKLNYIYRPNGNLKRYEIFGISALLNSKLFDDFFRIINGNVNVSATELRYMPLPSEGKIKDIGNTLILENNYNSANVNRIVNDILKNG